jgi:DNA repair photolyase
MPKVLSAAAAAGARYAWMGFLRLPGSVEQVFVSRIEEALPLRAERILSRVREARGGKLHESSFGKRHRGDGQYAASIQSLFQAMCARLGLNCEMELAPAQSTFRRPPKSGEQLQLL